MHSWCNITRGTRCDHCITAVSVYQMKAFSELCHTLPLSYCDFTACEVFPYKFQLNENGSKALCLYWTDLKGALYKYLRERDSLGQTGVTFQYSHCKALRRMSWFFQKYDLLESLHKRRGMVVVPDVSLI